MTGDIWGFRINSIYFFSYCCRALGYPVVLNCTLHSFLYFFNFLMEGAEVTCSLWATGASPAKPGDVCYLFLKRT